MITIMKTLQQYLSFLRFPNLVIIALTQYVLRFCTLYLFTDTPVFSELDFLIMVLATMIVAAGGYIINDIYDYPIDQMNKPEKTFINRLISRKNAWYLYISLNVLVVLSGVYFYVRTGWKAAYLYPLIGISMLWLYSYRLKKSILLGNFVVALFCALVPFMVYVPESTAAFPEYELLRNFELQTADMLYNVFAAYAMFAFLSTFYREIVKDIEDKEGDAIYGGRTLPIVLGDRVAKITAFALGIALIYFVGVVVYWEFYSGSNLRIAYAMTLIVLPILYSFHQLLLAKAKAEYHHVSQVIKVVMLTGLLYLVVFWWTV